MHTRSNLHQMAKATTQYTCFSSSQQSFLIITLLSIVVLATCQDSVSLLSARVICCFGERNRLPSRRGECLPRLVKVLRTSGPSSTNALSMHPVDLTLFICLVFRTCPFASMVHPVDLFKLIDTVLTFKDIARVATMKNVLSASDRTMVAVFEEDSTSGR